MFDFFFVQVKNSGEHEKQGNKLGFLGETYRRVAGVSNKCFFCPIFFPPRVSREHFVNN